MALLRTTVADEAQARALARRLVEGRLACCVHFHAIASVYAWEGQVEEAHEWLVEARTPAGHADAVWDAMLDGHPYDTPLVERLADALAPAKYARWAHAVTGPAEGAGGTDA